MDRSGKKVWASKWVRDGGGGGLHEMKQVGHRILPVTCGVRADWPSLVR
jgi:hypothetical protein